MNRALFLDRDGVVNRDFGHVHRIGDFEFIDGIFDFCAGARAAGFLIVIVTNQAGIAKGYYTVREFQRLNRWMTREFRSRGIDIAGVYYCPYHPQAVVEKFRRRSSYRKPGAGMLLRAARELHIDLTQSVLLGDHESDLEAGRHAGIGRVLLFDGRTYPDLFHGLVNHELFSRVPQ